MTFDTATLELGFVCATFTWAPHPSHPHPLTPSHLHCSPTQMCTKCTAIEFGALPACDFLLDTMNSYHHDTHELTSCITCNKVCTENTTTNSDVTKHTIYSCDAAKYSNTASGWSFPALSPIDLAYIMHTSGTTGRPKPVRVPHCCVVPNILDLTRRFSISSTDTIFNAAPLTFDPSIVEVQYSNHSLFLILQTLLSLSLSLPIWIYLSHTDISGSSQWSVSVSSD